MICLFTDSLIHWFRIQIPECLGTVLIRSEWISIRYIRQGYLIKMSLPSHSVRLIFDCFLSYEMQKVLRFGTDTDSRMSWSSSVNPIYFASIRAWIYLYRKNRIDFLSFFIKLNIKRFSYQFGVARIKLQSETLAKVCLLFEKSFFRTHFTLYIRPF